MPDLLSPVRYLAHRLDTDFQMQVREIPKNAGGRRLGFDAALLEG